MMRRATPTVDIRLIRNSPCLTANPSAGSIEAPWLCQFAAYGCSDPAADNFRSWHTVSWPSLCQYAGCNDTDASNYDSVVRDAALTRPLH